MPNTHIETLELGAGTSPHPDADVTLDIREDLPHIDYPGVDIGTDTWPLPDESVDRVICEHTLEHIPPESITHVWNELDRVLTPGGTAQFELPHAGTWSAQTDLTHQGAGGTTPSIDRYFGDEETAELEPYWPHLNWNVTAYAEIECPTFIRPSARRIFTMHNGFRSAEIVKIPFVDATVHIDIEKEHS
ncbi:methyltransferase domain-containing protein [Halosegnis sp.]|uniref:methyltransferase domain-containing protein n=1 Tax=Halosegnis sp. TaxID=2864959 RepID=UPI0035D43202